MPPIALSKPERKRKEPSIEERAQKMAARQRRQEYAYEQFAAGVKVADIVKGLVSVHGITRVQAYRDVKHARAILADIYNPELIAERRAECIAKAEAHYERCMEVQDFGTALNTLRWIGELHGITGPQQIAYHHHKTLIQCATIRAGEHSSTMKTELMELSDEELVKRARAQLDAFTAPNPPGDSQPKGGNGAG